MLVKTFASAVTGIDAVTLTIEVNVSYGTLKPVKGVLPIALRAREEGFKGIIVPLKNEHDAAGLIILPIFFPVINSLNGQIVGLIQENQHQRQL
jgi:predicted ATPase with chaperone activity